jgi:hypothetical protein
MTDQETGKIRDQAIVEIINNTVYENLLKIKYIKLDDDQIIEVCRWKIQKYYSKPMGDTMYGATHGAMYGAMHGKMSNDVIFGKADVTFSKITFNNRSYKADFAISQNVNINQKFTDENHTTRKNFR